jgi:hypothetical protein
VRYPERCLLKSAERRSIERNLPFDLSEEDIIIPDLCPILGTELVSSENIVRENSPTVDRIIPEKGYVKGNVQVISHKANTMKNNASIAELIKFAKWVNDNFGEY